MLKLLLILIGILVATDAVIMLLRIRHAVKVLRYARQHTRPYMADPANATQHMLILGDSTMYGAALKDPKNTIGGLLATDFPHATVETLAVSGAKTIDLQTQFAAAHHKHYNLVIMGTGGNDIVGLTPFSTVDRQLRDFLKQLEPRADKIILSHCVNAGNTGFFVFPLNFYFSHRTKKLSQLYTQIEKDFPKVSYVNFYRPMGNDYYTRKTRAKFVADDGFHPSDYAMHYFYKLMKIN